MSRGHDDYQVEPVPGLPEKLPEGERILWQGAPLWWQLAKDVFHIRLVGLYFAGLMTWRASKRMSDVGDWHAALASVVSLLPVALLGLGLLAVLARLASRTTLYTITTRRVVLRIGVALPVTMNIPFAVISAANLRLSGGDAGDIPLALATEDRVAYSRLWPHARPWHLNKPQPMLRAIPQAGRVAEILGAALRERVGQQAGSADVTMTKPIAARSSALRMVDSVGAASLG